MRLLLSLLAMVCMAHNAHAVATDAAFETKAAYAYMVDFDTGAVLLDKGGEIAMNPSSMSKLMTSYIAYQQIKEGKIKRSDTFPVSEKAWKMGGSKMFVHVGDQVSVGDLLRGITIQSGNDACIVLAEGIAGSEEAFALMMNETAKKLGLEKSHFVNATGWPDEEHLMSARDLATLAKHIIHDFPEDYKHYAETSFTYHGINQPNRNRLLGSTLGVDGLKTGHTEVAGYGITLSAKDPVTQRRVILVINGLESDDARVEEGAKLLGYGLKAFENKTIIKAGDVLAQAPVWFGDRDTIGLKAAHDVLVTLPKMQAEKIRAEITYQSPLQTPIVQGSQVAQLKLSVPGQQPILVPLIAADSATPAHGIRWMDAFYGQYLAGGK